MLRDNQPSPWEAYPFHAVYDRQGLRKALGLVEDANRTIPHRQEEGLAPRKKENTPFQMEEQCLGIRLQMLGSPFLQKSNFDLMRQFSIHDHDDKKTYVVWD